MGIKNVTQEIKSRWQSLDTEELSRRWKSDECTEEERAAVQELLVERGLDTQALPLTDCSQLQSVSNYSRIRKALKAAGGGNVVFGIIAIVMGFGLMEDNPVNAILGVIGLFLLVEGIWIFYFPRPSGMIVDSIAFVIVGVWNILITIVNLRLRGGDGFIFFGALGMSQIICGFQCVRSYKRFPVMPMNKPTDEDIRQVDNVVWTIARAKVKEQSDFVEFQTKTFTAQKVWKGKLSQDLAVFVQGSGQDIVFASKNDVHFVKQGKVLIGKTLKASFRIRDRKLTGTIAPEIFDRYEAWKR